MPCGRCRQLLWENGTPETLLLTPEGVLPMREVLPQAFGPDTLAAALGALLPEGAIVSDESVTTGRGFFKQTAGAPPHDWMNNMGGSIGLGLPLARALEPVARTHVLGQDEQNVVAIEESPPIIDEHQPISVAIKGEPEIGARRDDFLLQLFGVQRTAVQIDVSAIGLVPDHNRLDRSINHSLGYGKGGVRGLYAGCAAV